MWRSTRTSAPAADNARRSARPAPPPTRCRPPTRCCASCARCSSTYRKPAARMPSCCCTTSRMASPLIEALARHGDGLPANVLPLAVNEVTQVGLEAVAAAFAYGASALRFLMRAKPRHDVAGLHQDDRARRPDPRRARLRHGPRRHDRDRRSVRARRHLARDRARRTARRVPPRSRPSARSATCCGLRCANCIMRRPRRSISCRCPRARRSARSRSTSKAARSASPASRPARPARCPTIRTGRCCASPKMPACSAGCARRPARRR